MVITRYSAGWLAFMAAIVSTIGVARAEGLGASNEKQLLDVLRSAPPAEKAVACKHLAVHGTREAVPELAKLLSDEQLASWARIALEAIPDPAADEALRKAAPTLKGRLLVGTLNSIGVRRDAAAVEIFTGYLPDADPQVASAAAVALGHIGNDAATAALRRALDSTADAVRSAVAEGLVLCAEHLLAQGKTDAAVEIYDLVRKRNVPKPRKLEATRGAIMARKSAGIPLLLEQLRSADKAFFQLGLATARELPGREVADALAAELTGATPERAALLLYVLADRHEATIPPAVLEAAKSGPKQVRIAAIDFVGRLGDVASLLTLLEIAGEGDAEISQAAKAALATLPGEKVNEEVVARLAKADGKNLAILIELVGQRRIDATAPLVEAVDHPDAAIRGAALTALGETIAAKDLNVLVAQTVSPKNASDAQVAARALRAACIRMPDREACAAELAAAMPRASVKTQGNLLEILGATGGTTALATIGSAVKGKNEELQDTGSRLLGEWMTIDAGPVLLELAKNPATDKYQVRLLRGYIRLARQFVMPDAERAAMCASALGASRRAAEQELVLAVLERYPSVDTLRVAAKATKTPGLKEPATRTTLAIAQKIAAKSPEAQAEIAKLELDPMKIEILKAEYGAGTSRKDVTEALQRQVRDLPLISLPAGSYNDSLGGDPAPGTPKQLTIHYRINGKTGDASFAENAVIVLPMPK